MSATTSPATRRSYGIARVCEAWRYPRSTFYLERARRRGDGGAAGAAAPRPTTPATLAESPTGDSSSAHGPLLSDGAPAGGAPSIRRPHHAGTAAPQRSATEAGDPAHSHAQAPPESATAGPSMARTGVADVARSEHGGTLPRANGADRAPPAAPRAGRRGPAPRIADAEVLALVRRDLEASPFCGEGHRKVTARLRRAGHPVHRRQVLRVMREAQLLSPHRTRRGEERAHDGTIVTDGPDRMWGTDGLRVQTVEQGWVWIFVAVEHWNGEVVGWHAAKTGDRYAALEPLRQGLSAHHGGVGRGVAAGLVLRCDHGSQYTSEHFRKEVEYWGLELSYGYVAQPETNGVAERFNRTLKEQAIHGRVFRDLAELRAAVGDFIRHYNESWLLEKNGYRSPNETRRERRTTGLAMAA